MAERSHESVRTEEEGVSWRGASFIAPEVGKEEK